MARLRTAGAPTSPNGASSFHLWWEPAPVGARRVSVELRIDETPRHDRLMFWALQVDFESAGRTGGGAHIGLQWNALHPGGTAVNWGGYRAGGGLLYGTVSPLPSAPADPNTRDFPWRAGRWYRLEVGPGSTPGWWAGAVTDVETGTETHVRELAGGGESLVRPVVWTEAFAHCDDPSVSVTWRNPTVSGPARDAAPDRYRVSYQAEDQGGCSNTSVESTGDGVRQTTSTERSTPPGATVTVR